MKVRRKPERTKNMNSSIGLLIFAFLIFLSPPAQSQSGHDPAEMTELRERAEHAYRERDVDTATNLYSALTTMYPSDPELWLGLSLAQEWSGEIDEAILAAE